MDTRFFFILICLEFIFANPCMYTYKDNFISPQKKIKIKKNKSINTCKINILLWVMKKKFNFE